MQLDQDWQGFIRSIATYTRIPVKVDWSSTKEYTPSVCFLPLVGALVGVLSAWPLVLTNWSVEFQALMMMLTAVLITGAFHEDGLMDACDGLLGGWTPEQRLSIMKDSRIGSYGLMAGLFAFTIKWWLLTQWVIYGAWYSDVTVTLYGWIAMHISARWLPLGIMSCLHYVTLGDSKAQAMISPFTTRGVLWVILSFALVAVLIGSVALISIGLMLLLSLGLLVAYLSFKIRGYNGDTLGASEQIAEIVILFTLLGWKA